MSPNAENFDTSSPWRPDHPYNELPALPPKLDLETKAVLKQCITARAALAELKQAAELIPNQGALINTLPLLEAQASSEIENIVTTTDRLFQFRTGRVINSLFLIQENLLTLPILYRSRYIIAHKADYYRLLREVTSAQAWEPWVVFILRGVEETATWTTGKIAAIRALQEHTVEHARNAAPRTCSRELIEIVFAKPYCRIQDVVDAGLAARQTASLYLKELVAAKVLNEITVGREKLFIHPKLMRLLTKDQNDFVPYA